MKDVAQRNGNEKHTQTQEHQRNGINPQPTSGKNTDKQPNKQTTAATKQSHHDRVIVAATVVTCLTAIVSAVIAFFLWRTADSANRIAWASATAAKQSAEVAQQAVEQASETAQLELCAYVFAVDARVVGNEVTVTVRNSGKTPAFNTFIDSSVCWKEQIPCGAYLEEGETATLAPGEEFDRKHKIDPSRFRKGEVLHVHGTVSYVDVFGNERGYPFQYTQKELRAKQMSAVSTD